MAQTFYFYDLETSGVNPREARVMQFAGQRTDMDLEPVGDPHNIMIRMTDDVVPDPDAVLVTGITPQQTIQDGVSEAEFLQLFEQEIAAKDTIFVGYNTVRFDDEFMRYMHYRNFYDPYEWQWQDGRSRWDLLDVVRMTRALRPEGIQWPTTDAGVPTNKLELLTAANGLDHDAAHDALSDVRATIAVASMIKAKQPKLFDYLLQMRAKQAVRQLVEKREAFLYSSGRYANEYEKTTVAAYLCDHPRRQGALVYDLRHDPAPFLNMSPQELVEAWAYKPQTDTEAVRLPVKLLQYNRCPAVAPLGVADEASRKRLGIDLDRMRRHAAALQGDHELCTNLLTALDTMEESRQAATPADLEVDARLYDGFISEMDKTKMRVVRAADWSDMSPQELTFHDERLRALLPLYRARNFRQYLTDEERATWEQFRERKLLGGKQASRLAHFFDRLAELANDDTLDQSKRFLLEELQLYGQSIMPVTEQ